MEISQMSRAWTARAIEGALTATAVVAVTPRKMVEIVERSFMLAIQWVLN
jgi:uncharacterized protein YjfI (DUF2170 family)